MAFRRNVLPPWARSLTSYSTVLFSVRAREELKYEHLNVNYPLKQPVTNSLSYAQISSFVNTSLNYTLTLSFKVSYFHPFNNRVTQSLTSTFHSVVQPPIHEANNRLDY
jgi:hypothetical protein